MGGAVLAKRDAVVSEHVDDVQTHQRRQPDGRTHVVGEDQEGRAVRNQSSVRRDAVDDRAHRMLAHAEMKVAPGITPPAADGALCVHVFFGRRVEIAESLERGVGRGVEIRGAARQCRHTRRDGVHHLARSHARRHSLGVGGKHRHVCVPVSRQLAAYRSPQLLGQIGERLRIRRHPLAACRFVARAARHRFTEVRQRRFGNQERRLDRPIEIFLGQPHFFDTERGPVRLKAVVLVRRAEADVSADENQ